MNGRKTEGRSLPKVPSPEYLNIAIDPGFSITPAEGVSIRVPLRLLKAGIKLSSLLPAELRQFIDEFLRTQDISPDSMWTSKETLEAVVTKLEKRRPGGAETDRIRFFFE